MSYPTWKEVREQMFTPEERAESDRRVAEIRKEIEGEKAVANLYDSIVELRRQLEADHNDSFGELDHRKVKALAACYELQEYLANNPPVQYFKTCRVRCKRCGDVLEYKNKTKQDNPAGLLRCGCGCVALDPSATLYRVLGEPEDYEDLSEPWQD